MEVTHADLLCTIEKEKESCKNMAEELATERSNNISTKDDLAARKVRNSDLFIQFYMCFMLVSLGMLNNC